ncbi:MAG: Rieske 2Fe-2S domain-containing protein [Terriglobia bacterium]
MLLGISLVMGRNARGEAFAMRDSCPHRGMPLSAGRRPQFAQATGKGTPSNNSSPSPRRTLSPHQLESPRAELDSSSSSAASSSSIISVEMALRFSGRFKRRVAKSGPCSRFTVA